MAERDPHLIARLLVRNLGPAALAVARIRVTDLEKDEGDRATRQLWAEIVGEVILILDQSQAVRH